ncbi:MAG TPA: molybdopterin cofactor-binding domain-containing protein, partial [Acidimicrobiia bacterium]|nr:molybdopterin cofactor-binding domain-containing protein [Acidimicrobiia bacterium]
VRVIARDVGGSFGAKGRPHPEELLLPFLARRVGRPVVWVPARSTDMVGLSHGRGQIQYVRIGGGRDGRISAYEVRILQDAGAYPGGGALLPNNTRVMLTGCYQIATAAFSADSVVTNTTPVGAYRGAGRPEAAAAIERMVDVFAAELGMDPAEVRRRNFIPADAFPYSSAPGLVFDSGNYDGALDKALEMVGYDTLRKEQQMRRDAGSKTHLGIGLSTYCEMCGLAPSRVLAALRYGAGGWEAASVQLLPTGKVQVTTGTSPHGQSHETCWSQIVADRLGVSPDDVDVLHSDTSISPLGMDTYGSRSLAVGGTAVALATDKVIDKARTIAAHQLEVAEEDLEFANGVFAVKGTPDKAIPIQGIAFASFTGHNLPDGMEPNLRAEASYDPPNFVFPFGTHVCVVEVDEETGAVKLLKYVAVDDCGNQVNPMVIEGQVHGGVVQGIAQALFEEASYDADGNLLTSTLADYLVPSAAEMPSFDLGSTVTPSPSNPLGVKGIGEAGTIASTPAVINAIVDALSPLGVTEVRMPASPQRVWATIQEAQNQSRGEAGR